ncbi:MAG TPA: single-stranded DNA-binding protein [Thermomicrobiales bacterium]|nr:single-stranded DNA-binding protein [Thermomicrobiales bacterium]
MVRGLNKVQVIGNLGADPEARYLPSGQAVTNFRVAVNRQRRDPQGNAVEETEWFRCVAFDKLGEIAGEYLHRGRQVYVEGRLQTRKYTDRDGIERTAVEIVASDLVLLGDRREEGAGARAGAESGVPTADELADDEVPF